MQPMDALRAATANVAHAYRVDKHLGTVEVGKSSPTYSSWMPTRSSIPRNYRALHAVIKSGAVIDCAALPTERPS